MAFLKNLTCCYFLIRFVSWGLVRVRLSVARAGRVSIPIPILFYLEQHIQNSDIETIRTGTKTNKNSNNYNTLMSCIIKCIQYNQLKFQCVVVVITSVRNGLTKRDKSGRAWSTHCNKVIVGRLHRVELTRHKNIVTESIYHICLLSIFQVDNSVYWILNKTDFLIFMYFFDPLEKRRSTLILTACFFNKLLKDPSDWTQVTYSTFPV